jgi:hypothetical protein
MGDRELHHQLVVLYGILQDHIKATKAIEETLELLISLDPKLQGHIAGAHAPKRPVGDDSDALQPQNTDELLLRVQRVLAGLNKQG